MAVCPEGDDLGEFVEGVSAYFAELATYRATCLRHEATAWVRLDGGTPRVCRRAPLHDDAAATLRARAERLSGWERSPSWPAGAREWRHLHERMAESTHRPDAHRIVLRGVAWSGRPLLVDAVARTSDRSLVVDLLLPPVPGDLPELPLRAVALALDCLDHLTAGMVARPLPVHDPVSHMLPLRAYLERAMPQNLCASKCLSLANGAE